MQTITNNKLKLNMSVENVLGIDVVAVEGLEKTINVAINFGGINRKYYNVDTDTLRIVNPGLAHFLEHIICSSIPLPNTLAKTKRSLLNILGAYTSEDTTMYTINNTENLEGALELLLKNIFKAKIKESVIESERNIIIAEVAREGKSRFPFKDILYKEAYEKDYITGQIEEVKNITKEEILDAYNSFYILNNARIITTGYNKEEVFSLVKEIIKNLKLRKKEMPVLIYEQPVLNDEAFQKEDKRIVMFIKKDKTVKYEIVTDILASIIKTRTRDEVSLNVLPYRLLKDYSIISIINIKSKCKIFKACIDSMKKLEITEEEFMNAKRKLVYLYLARYKNRVELLVSEISDQLRYNKNFFEDIDLLYNISYDEFIEEAKRILTTREVRIYSW